MKEVGGAAPQVGASRVQEARKAHHGPLANPNAKKWIGTDETPWQGNAAHTAEYAGPGQCESTGSRESNAPHTDPNVGGYPQRPGGKVPKTSKERFEVRKNGQQN